MDALGNYLGMALYRQPQNPALSYFQGMQAAEVPIEMQLKGAQAQQAIGELEKERRLQTGMQGVDLSAPGGFEKAIGIAGKIDPFFALKLQAVKQSMDVESRNAFSQTLNNTTKYMNDALKTVVTPQQYEAVRANVYRMSPDIARGMPPGTELTRPDGTLDMNKLTLMTNRTQVVQDTLAHNREMEREDFRFRLQAKIDEAKDRREKDRLQMQLDKFEAANKTTIKEIQNPDDPGGPPVQALINTKTGDVIKVIGPKGTALMPETRDFYARQFLIDPKSIPMGFGPQVRLPIMNEAAKIAVQENIDPVDAQQALALRGAIKTGLGQLEGQRGKVMAFANTFDRNVEVLEGLIDKPHRSGIPLYNAWVNAGRRAITGDPDISALDVAFKTVANEFAKLTTSATGGGCYRRGGVE